MKQNRRWKNLKSLMKTEETALKKPWIPTLMNLNSKVKLEEQAE